MKSSSKPADVLLPLSSSSDNHGGGRVREVIQLVVFSSIFVFLILCSLMILRTTNFGPAISVSPATTAKVKPILHRPASSDAVAIGSSSRKMSSGEIKSVSAALSRCNNSTHCNFLVFGLTKETLLWHSLNQNGRTVFVENNAYLVRGLESNQPEIEAYDIESAAEETTEMYDLIESVKEQVRNECRPVQNLLYSDCPLGINDLPNYVYDVEWDVILVDGPRGLKPGDSAGRMSAIFTAGVLARSRRSGETKVDVFVNEFEREVEWVCSEEFLCTENLVESKGSLAHFVVGKMDNDSNRFCLNSPSPLPSPSP